MSKILIFLAVWCVVSVVVGLLVGRYLKSDTFQNQHDR